MAILLLSTQAFAQGDSAWPTFPLDEHNIERGSGYYLSIFKMILVWIVFLVWVKSCDWLTRDTLALRQNAMLWHSVCVGPFILAFMLMLVIPVFFIGWLLMVTAVAAPLGVYVFHRNELVDEHQRVLTPEHFRHVLSRKAERVGVTIEAEKKADHERGPDIQLVAQGGTSEENTANLYKCQQSAGYNTARSLIFDAIERRSEAIRLDFTAEAVAVRYQIDGVWHETDPRTREESDVMLAVFKALSNLDARERRQRQSGTFGATIEGKRYDCRFASAGTETGERAIVHVDGRGVDFQEITELGISEKSLERLKGVMAASNGYLLFSAPPASGLRTTFQLALASTDRIMRDVVGVAADGVAFPDVENIQVTRYATTDGEDLSSTLTEVVRAYPNVIVLPEVTDGAAVKLLCEEAAGERLVISTVRANDSAEALLRVLATKVPPAAFAKCVSGVVFQRLVRRLCDGCKVGYTPKPELLKKLGIPEGKVKAFYREPQGEEALEVCESCQGIGYRGRTAIFELLEPTSEVRKLLATGPKLDVLRAAIQKSGHRTLQTEGILLVARGVTSLQELTRALKQ
ncbi:MAG: Flp pilus assembly complex ATPase component TadA [Pirellulales bacterium]|nr:Flp pilus assembly complex ATPase component TadA [Pirellulales bacterium]